MHSKATETAIAAMGVLSAAYDGGVTKLSAARIAESRGLQRPFVSKVLTELARAGLVVGVRGPGGGFSLSRDPSTIYVGDVYTLFERAQDDRCPCGDHGCGEEWTCALHECFVRVRKATDHLLHETTFGVFQTFDSSASRRRPPRD